VSDRRATPVVAELRSTVRRRDQQLIAIEHDLNNEVGTLQLVVHLLRGSAGQGPERGALLDALARVTERIRTIANVFREQ
jgi:hypothetical protein